MDKQKENEFENYFLRYKSQVQGYIYRKVLNEQIAEDLTMDVFYSVYSKFESFDEGKATFQTWLYVIVNNRLKNYYRDKKEFVEMDESFMESSDPSDDIVEAIYLHNLRGQLYEALNNISSIQREIVIRKYFENLNSNEIADKLGITPGNVRIQLKRALEKIKNYLS